MTAVRSIPRSVFLALWGMLLLAGQPAPSVQAQAQNRAALVVSFADGMDAAVCVSFNEDEITGYELLRRSEFNIKSEPSGGFGEAICKIESTGCDIPQQQCWCECTGADCTYWSYWQLIDGEWTYAQQGASGRMVQNGSVDAWVWGQGVIGQNAQRVPPQVTFEEICVAATSTPTATPTSTTVATATTPVTGTQPAAVTDTPTATASPTLTWTPTREPSTATPTPIPSQTITPTPGPTPTPTPTPFVPPTIRGFGADRTPIQFGESVTLAWDVADATRVLLRYPGGEEEVPAQGNRTVTPEKTTEYSLFAASPVGQAEATLLVEVNPVISAPTAAPTSPPVALESAPLTSVPPTETPTATPTIPPTLAPTTTPSWTATAVPTATEMPLPTQTPVPPPADVAMALSPDAAGAQVEQPFSPLVVPEAATQASDGVDLSTAVPGAPMDAAPAVVLLDPVDSVAATSNARPDAEVERAFMLSGLIFVVGTPILFAGIWLVVWSVWRRR